MEIKRINRRPLDKQKEEQVGYDLFLETNLPLVERICTNFGSQNGANILREKFHSIKSEQKSRFPGVRHELIEVNREPAGILAYQMNDFKMSVLNISLYQQYRSQGIGSKIIKDLITLAKDKEFESLLPSEIENNL